MSTGHTYGAAMISDSYSDDLLFFPSLSAFHRAKKSKYSLVLAARTTRAQVIICCQIACQRDDVRRVG